jgi:hypothetical protein
LAIRPTLITSYNTITRRALVFKNRKPEHAQFVQQALPVAESSDQTTSTSNTW